MMKNAQIPQTSYKPHSSPGLQAISSIMKNRQKLAKRTIEKLSKNDDTNLISAFVISGWD
ncbi:hypothetical protein GSY37_15515 [Listeria monocytogenes]|nr:hypothetical protein [Listeria monocytogenes]